MKRIQCFSPSNDIYKHIQLLWIEILPINVRIIIKNNRNDLYEVIIKAFETKNTSIKINEDCSFDSNQQLCVNTNLIYY